ncbi:MAG: hypothetical protein KF836_08185 [Fimbriimonadaceae bacterium]|nr:hypothetical protein [Fimbriimonadaceae bacterium]
MSHKFTEQQVREILARAEQIHLGATNEQESDTKALIKAAEEAGLPREAVEQALRERLDTQTPNLTPGEFVFAPSTDGKLYVAEVKSSGSNTTTVQFLIGSELSVPSSQIQPAVFLPGSKVKANWPHWGWWTCTVLSFDKPNRLVRLSDGWGTEKTFPLTEIRLDPPRIVNTSSSWTKLAAKIDANPTYKIAAWCLFVTLAIPLFKTLIQIIR